MAAESISSYKPNEHFYDFQVENFNIRWARRASFLKFILVLIRLTKIAREGEWRGQRKGWPVRRSDENHPILTATHNFWRGMARFRLWNPNSKCLLPTKTSICSNFALQQVICQIGLSGSLQSRPEQGESTVQICGRATDRTIANSKANWISK